MAKWLALVPRKWAWVWLEKVNPACRAPGFELLFGIFGRVWQAIERHSAPGSRFWGCVCPVILAAQPLSDRRLNHTNRRHVRLSFVFVARPLCANGPVFSIYPQPGTEYTRLSSPCPHGLRSIGKPVESVASERIYKRALPPALDYRPRLSRRSCTSDFFATYVRHAS